MRPQPPRLMLVWEVRTVAQKAVVHPGPVALAADSTAAAQAPARPSVRAAAVSFVLGLFALRVCWLPGVNCLLALGSLAFGITAALQILRSRGRLGGMEEAITGIVLGLVVLAVSVFFLILFVAALR